MTIRESWTAHYGWHQCTAQMDWCTWCARMGRYAWRVNGQCPRCDDGPLVPCCDGDTDE